MRSTIELSSTDKYKEYKDLVKCYNWYNTDTDSLISFEFLVKPWTQSNGCVRERHDLTKFLNLISFHSCDRFLPEQLLGQTRRYLYYTECRNLEIKVQRKRISIANLPWTICTLEANNYNKIKK